MNQKTLLIVGAVVGIILIAAAVYWPRESSPQPEPGTTTETETPSNTPTTGGTEPATSGGTGKTSQTQTPGTTASKTPSPTSGRVIVSITDAAANLGDIRSINMTVTEIKVHSTSKGWLTIPGAPKTYELLDLRRTGSLAFFGEAYLEKGDYNQFWITVKDIKLTKVDGSTATAKLPSGSIRFPTLFKIAQGETTSMAFDFDVSKALHTAVNGTYIFFPVLQLQVRPSVIANINAESKVLISGGASTLTVNVGVDKNGASRDGYFLSPLTNLEYVGTVLKFRRYDLSEMNLAFGAARAIELAKSASYLDTVATIELKEANGLFWEIIGAKNSLAKTIFLDPQNGNPVER